MIKFLIAYLILYPLCYRNFRLRGKGKLPDKPYWADIKLAHWGYLYRNPNSFPMKTQESQSDSKKFE